MRLIYIPLIVQRWMIPEKSKRSIEGLFIYEYPPGKDGIPNSTNYVSTVRRVNKNHNFIMSENDEDTGDCETIELIELPQNKQKRKEPLGVAPIVTATVTAARFGFRGCCALFVASACIILVRVVLIAYNRIAKSAPKSAPTYGNSTFPEVLLESDGVYSVEDFKNPLGRSPRYWNDLLQTQDHNSSTIPHWGPCYEPKLSLNEDDWRRLILSSKERESDNYVKYVLKDYDKEMSQNIRNGHNTNTESKNKDLSGLCRPGFLIIGVGKCGTSSLYQYLVGHPRVLPAFRKQIHYFKYYTKYPMKWYLSNFPTTESFVSSGALMTGESSPGYIVSILFLLFHSLAFLPCMHI